MVVDLLVAHNPIIWLIQGCPRTPRDQGSVENANKLVQRVLKAISEERRQKALPVNWTNLLGQVMSVCNSQTGIRQTDCSSYQAVFGQRIHHHLRCSVEDVRKCTSIHQRLRMSPDERLEQYVRDNDIVDVTIPDVVADDDGEEEEGVDDPNKDEGADISDETFPDCNEDGVPPRQVLEGASRQVPDDAFVEDQGNVSLGDQRNDTTLADDDDDALVDVQGDASLGDQRNDTTLADNFALEDQQLINSLADVRVQDHALEYRRIDTLDYDHSDPTVIEEDARDDPGNDGAVVPAVLFVDEDDRKPPFIMSSQMDDSSVDDDDSKKPADITSSVAASRALSPSKTSGRPSRTKLKDDDSKVKWEVGFIGQEHNDGSYRPSSGSKNINPPSRRDRSVRIANRGGHDSFNVETQEYDGDKPTTPGIVRVRQRDYHRFTLSQAWDRDVAHTTYPLSHAKLEVNKFQMLVPTLTCADCCQQGPHSQHKVNVIEDDYLNSIVDNDRMWWDGDFITSFTQMAAHYAHSVMYPAMQSLNISNQTIQQVPQVMHLTYPRDPITEEKIIHF